MKRMATELKLHIAERNGKSVITESYFTSPLKLGTPHTGRDRLKVVLMMASAGILKGDSFHYEIVCGANTKTLLTEQSYSKIFDTGEGRAEKIQTITVSEGASLYYRPCAVIPFSGSSFQGKTEIKLEADSEFAYADIMAAGRIGMGERFRFRKYGNRVCVSEADKPVWIDNCLLVPERMEAEGMLFFDGFTHQGTFYYYGTAEKEEMLSDYFSGKPEVSQAKFFSEGQETEKGLLKSLGEEAEGQTGFQENERVYLRCGVSKALKGVCVRILAYTAQDIEDIFDRIEELLKL